MFEEALAAVAEVLSEHELESDLDGETLLRGVELEAPDLRALLVAWIDELVYLAEVEELLPMRVVDLELGEGRLAAAIEARPGRVSNPIKAATFHRLAFERTGTSWRANVVLDV